MPKRNEDFECIKRHCDALRAHFDTVQIFCTNIDKKTSLPIAYNHGDGNFLTILGQVTAFVQQDHSHEYDEEFDIEDDLQEQ